MQRVISAGDYEVRINYSGASATVSVFDRTSLIGSAIVQAVIADLIIAGAKINRDPNLSLSIGGFTIAITPKQTDRLSVVEVDVQELKRRVDINLIMHLREVDKDEYVALDALFLVNAMVISGHSMNNPLLIETSDDNKTWTAQSGKVSDDGSRIWFSKPVLCKYIRIKYTYEKGLRPLLLARSRILFIGYTDAQ